VGYLMRAHLLLSPRVGRYRYHDLLQLYARTLAERHDSVEARAEAEGRLRTWYTHTASAAMDILHPYEKHRRPHLAVADLAVPRLDTETARAWLATEHVNLMGTAERAATDNQWRAVTDLSTILWRHLMSTALSHSR
jgi:hypothetical protein